MNVLRLKLTWLKESWFLFLLFLGLAGLFFSLPLRQSDQVLYPGDITTFYAPGKSVDDNHSLQNSILSDVVMIYTPRHELMWRHLENGSWLNYNPYLFGGRPASINIPYTLLQLPGWITGGVIEGFQTNTLWQIAVGAVFFYWLMRDWKVSRTAAVAGSLVWVFGQHQVVWYLFSAHLQTQMWFPLILLFFRWLYRSPSARNFLLFTGTLSFSWFAGYTQGLVYFFLFLGLYFVYLTWQEQQRSLSLLARRIGVFALSLLVFFLLAGHTALNFTSAIEAGIRGQQAGQHTPSCDLCSLTGIATNLSLFIHPDILGNGYQKGFVGPKNIVEFGRYMGLLPLLLGVLATIYKRWNKETLFFLAVALLSFSAMHGVPLIRELIYGIPFLNIGQATRLVTLILFSGALLTGLLLDPVLSSTLSVKALPQQSWKVLLPLFLLGSTVVIGLIRSLDLIEIIWAGRSFLLFFCALIAYVAFTLIGVRRHWQASKISLGLTLILFLELWVFLGNFNTFSPRDEIFPQTELTQWLQENAGDQRILPSSTIYIPNTASFHSLKVINGYSTTLPLTYYQWLQDNFSAVESTYNGVLSLPAERNEAVDQLAVKYILSETPTSDPTLEYVTTLSDVLVYENPQAWPRTWIAAESACLAEECKFSWPETALSDAPHESTWYTDGASIQIESPEPGWLVISQQPDENWQATVNGTPAQLQAVNPALMTLPLPAGKNSVELRYPPKRSLLNLPHFFSNRLRE